MSSVPFPSPLLRVQVPDSDQDPLMTKRESVKSWKQDSAGGGVRARSPGVSSPSPSSPSKKAVGARGGGGGAAEAGGVARGGRELSFWGFAKQLSSHANSWL